MTYQRLLRAKENGPALLSALQRLMACAGDICEVSDDELRSAEADAQADALLREQAGATLQAREAIRKTCDDS